MDTFFDLVAKRESCRNYADRPVEQEKLVACIDAARLAPSACNSQPWYFYVVNGPENSPKVAECAQHMGMNKFVAKCPAFCAVVEKNANFMEKLGSRITDQKFAETDIGIAAAHYCLAATQLGLSTCILGSFNEKKIKSFLGLSKASRVRLIIATGYAANAELRKKTRKSMNEIAKFM